jgi:PBP1b-binding outer membrane lipoprotein LpoB
MLQAMIMILLVLMSIAGCSNEYDACIEREKKQLQRTQPKSQLWTNAVQAG